MAGFGRFKLTDALPEQPAAAEDSPAGGPGQGSAPVRKGKGKGKNKSTGKPALGASADGRENPQAKSVPDVARGNQQATTNRSRAK